EGPKLPVGRVPHRLACRFAHRIRKPQGRRRHGGVFAVFFFFPPPDPRRRTPENSPPPPLHLSGPRPLPPLVPIVEPTVGAEVDSVRASQAVREWAEFPLRRDFQAEAAIGDLRLVSAAETDVQSDEEIPLFVTGRAEDVFVIVARQSKLVV